MEERETKLFSLVKKIHEEKFWEEYWDTDMLAIQLPENEEPIFVSFLGKGEGNVGLLIYRNLKELAYLFETLAYADEWNSFRLLLLQSCLAVHYEDRETLTKEEYERVKASGVTFRGRKAWPVFTSFQPRYYPKTPVEEEMEWLAEVLEKVLETAEDFRSKRHFYEDEDEDFQFLLREYKADGSMEDGLFDVPEEVLQGLSPDIIGRQPVLVSEFEMMRVKQVPWKQRVWEMDLEEVEVPVVLENEEERAFFPSIWMVVDPVEHTILETDVVKEDEIEELQRKLVQLFLSAHVRPSEMMVSSVKEPFITAYFWELLHELGIRLVVVEELPVITSIKERLEDLSPDES